MAKKAEDIFKRAAGMIAETSREREEKKKLMEEDRRALLERLGTEVTRRLEPALNAMVENASLSREDLKAALSQLRIETPQVPEVKIPPINVPQPKVTVQAPEVKVPPMPAINIPETVFPEEMSVRLLDVDKLNPLPAMLVDSKGNPMSFGSSVSGGGKADFLTIKDIRGSTASIIDQIDGALKVTGDLSATLSADYGEGEIGDNTLRIVQATNAVSSTNVVSTVGLTDTELRASSVPVAQASGAVWSTEVTNTVSVSSTDLDIRDLSSSQDSVIARYQVRGSLSTAYVSITDSSEDTLIAASAGTSLDLKWLMCANSSDSAVTVHVRSASGGGIVSTVVVPAESTAGIAPDTPIPQDNQGNAWTVQNAGSDISNTTVYVTALFSQE